MQTEIPFFVFCVLIHISIYLTSNWRDRRLRLTLGMVILFLALPAWYGGTLLEVSEETMQHWLGRILQMAPYYLPLISFIAYVRKRNLF